MDMTTLGAALAVAKSMPGTAAESAARAEAAAAIAESVAPKVLDTTWTQQTISRDGTEWEITSSSTRCLSGLLDVTEGDTYTSTNGVKFRLALEKNGEAKAFQGDWTDSYTITSGNASSYDKCYINVRQGDGTDAITPDTAEANVHATGSNTVAVAAASADDLDALETRVSAIETVDVDITSTTPSITAAANRRYLCGTLTSLSFTPCNKGICEVVFTSGSTPTVLTLPNTVKMPDWWTGVAANRTYDIMIADGTLGVVTSWAT